MKKYIILALAAAFIATPLLYGASLDRVIRDAHTIAFGKANLFDQKISYTDYNKWFDAIKMVRAFVEKNGKDLLGRRDKTLFYALDEIEQETNSLTDSIEKFYALKDTDKTVAIVSEAASFYWIEKEMGQLREELLKKKYILPRKKECKELLLTVGILIQGTAVKALRDTGLSETLKKYYQ